MQRLVVDTNVLVAGLLTTEQASPTARIVDGLLNGRVLFLLYDWLNLIELITFTSLLPAFPAQSVS